MSSDIDHIVPHPSTCDPIVSLAHMILGDGRHDSCEHRVMLDARYCSGLDCENNFLAGLGIPSPQQLAPVDPAGYLKAPSGPRLLSPCSTQAATTAKFLPAREPVGASAKALLCSAAHRARARVEVIETMGYTVQHWDGWEARGNGRHEDILRALVDRRMRKDVKERM
jgi:hypothetical protein